ncbi:MAG: hypothetical protein JRI79_14165 [Deltaproteobacteria bacterium]|nr:hypothetical protein [Deltaproteobacteria bacterium]MBW1920178.1 hypothetical protein [Deltaproteobacteria bacterium]MBW1934822.1 hypothetical protein [Deltaproteobacteria bacterium]MBW1979091.1 hypothetical protein [Deltaproteobacteria bacterium]MBW2045735.1 hypothetical protein [Deltaproteobacteria bacterium]
MNISPFPLHGFSDIVMAGTKKKGGLVGMPVFLDEPTKDMKRLIMEVSAFWGEG